MMSPNSSRRVRSLASSSGRQRAQQSERRARRHAPQTPTFTVNVDYVEVDAVVTDRDGQFVRDLKKEDFQIFEDGKPQTISTFSIVDIPVERSQRPLFAAAPIEPDVKSNERPFDGRIYVMVIDDLHTYFGRTPRVRAAARQFIEQHLGANDLMAVVHTAGADGCEPGVHQQQAAAARGRRRTMGRKLDSATADEDRGVLPARASLGQRGDRAAERSGGGRARVQRAPVARRAQECRRLVCDRARPPEGDPVRQRGDRLRHHAISTMPAVVDCIMDATRETIAAAARGNVSIYGIDPRGLTNLADETIEVGSFPDDTSARPRPSIDAAGAVPVAGQPAAAVRRDRRVRGRQLATISRPPSIASCATTARTT